MAEYSEMKEPRECCYHSCWPSRPANYLNSHSHLAELFKPRKKLTILARQKASPNPWKTPSKCTIRLKIYEYSSITKYPRGLSLTQTPSAKHHVLNSNPSTSTINHNSRKRNINLIKESPKPRLIIGGSQKTRINEGPRPQDSFIPNIAFDDINFETPKKRESIGGLNWPGTNHDLSTLHPTGIALQNYSILGRSKGKSQASAGETTYCSNTFYGYKTPVGVSPWQNTLATKFSLLAQGSGFKNYLSSDGPNNQEPSPTTSQFALMLAPSFSSLDDGNFLVLPNKYKPQIYRLYTLSGKYVESDNQSEVSSHNYSRVIDKIHCLELFADLACREVSQSKNEYSCPHEDDRTMQRTQTLPYEPLNSDNKKHRYSHQVSTRLLGSVEEESYLSSPKKKKLELRDAKTINSLYSKENDTYERSEVLYKKSLGSGISSLKIDEEVMVDFKKKEVAQHNSFSLLTKGSLVGVGRFSSWYYAEFQPLNFLLMVKEMEKNTIYRHNLHQQLQNYIDIHKRLDHPNILPLYTALSSVDKYYLLVEAGYATLATQLRTVVGRGETIPEAKIVKYLKDLLEALDYLHEVEKICHGGLAPDRVILVADRCKLFDFSAAQNIQKCSNYFETFPPSRPHNNGSRQRDCWHAAMICLMMLRNKTNFSEALRQYGQEIDVKNVLATYELKRVLYGLLNPHEGNRLTARQALLHPIFI